MYFQCLTPGVISKVLNTPTTEVTHENFGHLSIIFLYYINDPMGTCHLLEMNDTNFHLVLGLTTGNSRQLLFDTVIKLEIHMRTTMKVKVMKMMTMKVKVMIMILIMKLMAMTMKVKAMITPLHMMIMIEI